MLYMPVSTMATPMVLSGANSVPLQSTSQYYMLQSTSIAPAVPIANTTYIYPRYGFIPRPVETSISKEEVEKSQATQLVEVAPAVQHVVHHHIRPYGQQTCPGYCDLCCPWIDHSNETRYQRSSRRDQFEHDELDTKNPSTRETIEERIERIRQELGENPSNDTVVHHVHYANDRPLSSSSPTRERWRSTNQNDYSWRDAHLPAYRDSTLTRSQTNLDESYTKHETAHERSHRNTRAPTSYYSKKDFIYRPKSETEARKWYQQTTGKDPDREVHQALRGGTTAYQCNDPSTSNYHCSSSTVVPTCSKVHRLTKIDSTQHHDLYASNHSSLHVVPKQSGALDAPYVKILNAPITYLH